MSRPSQIVIGSVTGLLGILILTVSGQVPDLKLIVIAAIAFCISAACFIPKSRPVTMRLIGAVIVVTVAGALLQSRDPDSEPLRPRGYVFAALAAAAGGCLAVTGTYPSWGAYGGAVTKVQEENARKRKPPKSRRRGPGSVRGAIE